MRHKYKGRWVKKRESILRRDGYLCQECKRYGRATSATTVHHVMPVDTYPELYLSGENLISLCAACHEAMHDRASGAISNAGRGLQERHRAKIFSDPPPGQH